jgi:THO complex subunit 1
VKDNGYSARFVFVKPPGDNVLRATLEEGGLDSDKVEEVLKSAAEDTAHAHSGDFYDLVVVDDELDNAYKVLEEFIYGSGSSGEQLNGDQAHQAAGTDVQMDDAPTRTQPRAEQTNGVQG